LPQKKKAHFYRIEEFSLGEVAANGKALAFLTGGTCRASKMYLYYCTGMPFGKGKIGKSFGLQKNRVAR
jgi:hypothetical protein